MADEIVVGVSASVTAVAAVRWAARLARTRRLPVTLVHSGRDARALARAVSVVEGEGVGARAECSEQSVVPLLIEWSALARMLVLGSSERASAVGRHTRSPALTVAARAGCPVVIVRGECGPGPVVVGVDGSEAGERAVGLAFDEAAHRGVPLVALHASSDAEYRTATVRSTRPVEWEPRREADRRPLSERLAGWRERYPEVAVDRIVVRDRPRHHLLRWSERAQLVVVGTRGRGSLPGMVLGSTSRTLAQRAGCPVMVVPPR